MAVGRDLQPRASYHWLGGRSLGLGLPIWKSEGWIHLNRIFGNLLTTVSKSIFKSLSFLSVSLLSVLLLLLVSL